MSKMIQVRNVPDQLHRKLKARAAELGISLSDLILAELRHVPERIPPQELAERASAIVRKNLEPSPATLLRAERDHLADQLTEANKQLADANVRLERQVANQDVALELHHRMLELSQDVLEHLPVGVIGIGDDGLIALANELAHRLLHQPLGALLSRVAADVLPAEIQHLCTTPVKETKIKLPAVNIVPGRTPVQVHCARLGEGMRNSGTMLVLVPEEG